VKFLGAKAGWANLRQILQFKQDLTVCALAITMDDGFALFIIFGQCPGRDRLNVACSKSGPAVGIEDIAATGLIKDGPNFESLAQFPTSPVQYGAPTRKLRWLTLVSGAFSEIVECLLAGNFQPDCFKCWIHVYEATTAVFDSLLLVTG
jgi:hypothetical protein